MILSDDIPADFMMHLKLNYLNFKIQYNKWHIYDDDSIAISESLK